MESILKLQRFAPEKFSELCRMHLTFSLDLHDAEFSNLIEKPAEKKKTRGYFGRFLKDKSESEMILNEESISQIYQVIEFLGRETNITMEGLFRKSGSLTRQNELKSLLKEGEIIDFATGYYTAHDCACVLKNILSDLPEPLLSEAHYFAHCQITDMCQENVSPSQKKSIGDRQLKSTKFLLLLLPPDNYCLLQYLLLLLNQIQNARESNKMSSKNLAVLFAPHIICPRKMSAIELKENFPRMTKCISFLIENAPEIFKPPEDLVEDVTLLLKDIHYTGELKCSDDEASAVKTKIAFCEQTPVIENATVDYTSNALSELESYIHNLPNSSRKRKLIKKLQKENYKNNNVEPSRKHCRSQSVGATIKRHFIKKPENDKTIVELFSASNNMISSRPKESTPKSGMSKSVDTLCYNGKESSKLFDIRKHFSRASRKKNAQVINFE